jgi:hypothetical protein
LKKNSGKKLEMSSTSSVDSFYSAESDFSDSEFKSQSSIEDEEILLLLKENEERIREREKLHEKLKKKLKKSQNKRKNKDVFWQLASDYPEYYYFTKILQNHTISREERNHKTVTIYYNLPQGGKLKATLNLALISQNEGYTTFVVLMPQITHENQFKCRVSTYNNEGIDEMAEKVDGELDKLNCVAFPFKQLEKCRTINVVEGNREYDIDFDELERLGEKRESVRKFLSCVKGSSAKGTVFTIATVERLDLLEKIVSHYNTQKTQLIIDEADSLFATKGEKNRKFTIPLAKLYMRSSMIDLFTATPIKLCYHSLKRLGEDIDFNVICLPRSLNHVSITDYEFDTDMFNGRFRLKPNQSVSTHLPEIKEYLDDFIEKPFYAHEVDDESPIEFNRNISLLNISDNKKHHEELYLICQKIKKERFSVVSWNGDAMNVYFAYEKYQKRKKHTNLILKGQKFENIGLGNYYLASSTEKNIMIEDILTYIDTSRNSGFHGNVIIITGEFAGRSINYVCSSFKRHITEQVYLPARGLDSANVIQAMARANGIFYDKDSYTPKVYTTETGKLAALNGTETIEYLMSNCEGDELTIEEYNEKIDEEYNEKLDEIVEMKLPGILDTNIPAYTVGSQKKKIPKKQFCQDGKSEVNTKFEPKSVDVAVLHIGRYVNSQAENKFKNQDECYETLVESYSPEFQEILNEKRGETKNKIITKVEVPNDLNQIYHLTGEYTEQQQRCLNMIFDLISRKKLNRNTIYPRSVILTDSIKTEYKFTYHSLAGHLSHLCNNPETPKKYFGSGITFYNERNNWYFVVV